MSWIPETVEAGSFPFGVDRVITADDDGKIFLSGAYVHYILPVTTPVRVGFTFAIKPEDEAPSISVQAEDYPNATIKIIDITDSSDDYAGSPGPPSNGKGQVGQFTYLGNNLWAQIGGTSGWK